MKLSRVLIPICTLTCGLPLLAEELEPRSYTNIPINQHFFAAVYAYSDGDVYTASDLPVENFTLQIDGPALGYARTFDLFGNSAKFDIALGQACAKGQAIYQGEFISRKWCGYTDTKFRLNYNFIGAPALTLSEYVKQPKSLVVGTSLQVSAPTGNYDKDFIFNIGSHRWYFKPELGMSTPLANGFSFDASMGVKIFTDNDEFKRTSRFKQDPIYNIQSHLIYDISPGQWIAFNANYFDGGDTYIDGERSGIKRGNFRAGVTYTYALNSQHSLKFFANTGVTTRYGNDSQIYAIAWAYRWD